jgi:hypothetical protein
MNRRLSIPSFSPPVPPQSEKARMWLSLGSEAWSVNSAFAIPDTSHSGLGAIEGGHAIENRLLPFSGSPVDDVITAGLSASLHGAFAHTGKLCRRGSAVALGTATAISPTHILVARHGLNQFRLSDLHFRIDGREREMRLVEDGARHGYDYAVLEVVAHSFESFVRLDPVQPPVSGFAVGYAPDDQLILHAEDKPLATSFFLQEVNYLPTEAGMSGAVYRDMVTGNGFALHIKRCVEGLFEGQNTGILVSELLQSLPMTSALSQLCRGEYDMPSIEMPHPFSCFSTAMADEIDQGGGLGWSDLRTLFQDQLGVYKTYFLTPHMKVGLAAMSMAVHDVSVYPKTAVPLIIEIMAPNLVSARAKIEAIHQSGRMAKNPVTLLIALNQEVASLSDKATNLTLEGLKKQAIDLSTQMKKYKIPGACIPFVWISTDPNKLLNAKNKETNRGYVFPFLEARSLLSLHPEVQPHDKVLKFDCPPVVRWMDADVMSDILLAPVAPGDTERAFQCMLDNVSRAEKSLASGGYVWDTTNIAKRLMGLKLISSPDDGVVARMQALITAINTNELALREDILKIFGVKSVYWPEPNLYAGYGVRTQGAVNAYEMAKQLKGRPQDKESVYLVNVNLVTGGMMIPCLSAVKPIKDYLDGFFEVMVRQSKADVVDVAIVRSAICDIRQTHLNADNVADIHRWHNRGNGDNSHNRFNEAACAEVCETHLSACANKIVDLLRPKTELRNKTEAKQSR